MERKYGKRTLPNWRIQELAEELKHHVNRETTFIEYSYGGVDFNVLSKGLSHFGYPNLLGSVKHQSLPAIPTSRKLCLVSHHGASKPFSRPSFLAAIWWMETTTLVLILASLQSCLRYVLSWPNHWMAAATAYFLSGQFMRGDFMGAPASDRPALEQKKELTLSLSQQALLLYV
jgi:hypothetical protein